ncbi:hypothetical protein PINS_up016729 [Pythium insidiosum]|nr:hypothetical protein PINS_up016729 [Pythium insidiosum]
MAALERERQRLRSLVASPTALVLTSATQPPTELVHADALRLVETRQQQLRRQIQRVREALAIASPADPKGNNNSNENETDSESELLAAIRRLELQLARHSRSIAVAWGSSSSLSTVDTSSESSASTSRSQYDDSDDTVKTEQQLAVLTRCRSLPAQRFHETWSELRADERRQLHRELRAAASFRIQRDRVPFPSTSAPSSSSPVSSRSAIGVQAFTRHPPTAADRLGVKALFLEQSHRDAVEIQRVYQRALALEPSHVVLLRHYARFLHGRCGQSDAAIALLESALVVDPSDAATIAALAHLLHRSRGDLDRAEELYLRVLALRPEDPLLLGDYASLLRKRATDRLHPLHRLHCVWRTHDAC